MLDPTLMFVIAIGPTTLAVIMAIALAIYTCAKGSPRMADGFNTLHVWATHEDHCYCRKCGLRWESNQDPPISPCPGKRMPFGRRKGAK